MNRFLTIFFAFSLAFFLVGAARFLYPEWFIDGPDEVTREEQNTNTEEQSTETVEDILPPPPADEQELFTRAKDFYDHGALSIAENDLALLLQRNPQNRDGLDLMIKLHTRKRNFAAAEATARKALEYYPNDSQFLLLLGDAFLQQGKFEEAKITFSALPETSAERNFFLGVIALIEADYDTAQTLLANVQNSAALQRRSEILLAAFREFALFPDGSPLHRDTLLAKALNDVEMYESSLRLSKKALLEDTGYRDAWLTNGYSYLALGRYEFAINSFQKAFEIDPSNPITAYYIGMTSKQLNDLDRALVFLERARENGFEPEREVLREMADTYYLQENYQLSLQALEQMLALDGTQISDYIRPMHIALNLLNTPDTAIALGNQAVQLQPQSALALNLRGWAFLENGDLDRAEADLTKALTLDDSVSAIYLNLGLLREEQEHYNEALDLYETAYNMDPLSDIGKRAVELYNALVQ